MRKFKVGLVFKYPKEAEAFVRINFPKAIEITQHPYIAESNIYRFNYIPAFGCFLGKRFDYVVTTKEIKETEWFTQIVYPMLMRSKNNIIEVN